MVFPALTFHLTMSDVSSVSTPDGPMGLHWAIPKAAAGLRSLPGILVFQEAFGVNRHIVSVCERLAAAGYVAVAPELFHREGTGLTFGYNDFNSVRPIFSRMSNEGLVADIRASHQALRDYPLVDPARIYAIGFCLGGFVAVLAAMHVPLASAAAFYGGGLTKGRPGVGLTPLIDGFGQIDCRTLFVFGEKDSGIPAEDVALIRSRLEALHKPHEIEVYPDAGHGFFCEDRPVYNPQAAAAAWDRALAWLR